MEQQQVMHSFRGTVGKGATSAKLLTKSIVLIFAVVILSGAGTGYVLSNKQSNTAKVVGSDGKVEETEIKKGDVIGSEDESTFSDSAEGELKEGGIEGEGQYRLERPGGESQNVYLTSSVLDLSPFIGRKVKVWGQTYAGNKAGWLMDVGRLQVLE